MDFTQIKPEELLNRYVIIGGNKISKIIKINKATFQVANGDLFNLNSGKSRGTSPYSTHWADLLTDEEADNIRMKWKQNKEARYMRDNISNELNNLTYDQLKQIIEIINSAKT